MRVNVCDWCGERRCAKHCRCGREGTRTGRRAPRAGDKRQRLRQLQQQRQQQQQQQQAGQAAPATAAPAAPAPPPGRPAALSAELLEGSAWFARLAEDLASASSVVLCTYTYDDAVVQALAGNCKPLNLKP